MAVDRVPATDQLAHGRKVRADRLSALREPRRLRLRVRGHPAAVTSRKAVSRGVVPLEDRSDIDVCSVYVEKADRLPPGTNLLDRRLRMKGLPDSLEKGA